jgi:ABC-type multidrug transport system permease subunit
MEGLTVLKDIIMIIVGIIILATSFILGIKSEVAHVIALTYVIAILVIDIITNIIKRKKK